MTVWVPLLVCIVGLIVYAITNNAKAATLALHCFWVGLLVFLLRWSAVLTFR
jgi:hypothetical protein